MEQSFPISFCNPSLLNNATISTNVLSSAALLSVIILRIFAGLSSGGVLRNRFTNASKRLPRSSSSIPPHELFTTWQSDKHKGGRASHNALLLELVEEPFRAIIS